MYCPKCSQQQISEEMRFCSRCGFPLEGLKELVAAGGVIEKYDVKALEERNSKLFCEIRRSVALMVGAIPMLLVVGLLAGLINDAFSVLVLVPALCFISGFIRIIYVTSKEKKRRQNQTETTPAQLNTTTLNAQLPPPRVVPVDNFTARKSETAEMVRPPSVTENTTRLLDEEPASQR